MRTDECLQTLMLDSGATAEEIRQAYLDMVRVWHPDRFVSDPRLRQVAEERLRTINEAYMTLRQGCPEPQPQSQPRPATTPPAAAPSAFPPRPQRKLRPLFRFPVRFRLKLPSARTTVAKLGYGIAAATLCLAPLLAAEWWSRLWRIPIPGVAQSQIGLPLPNLGSFSFSNPSGSPAPALPADPAPARQSGSIRRQSSPRASLDVATLANGTELLPVQSFRGAGEIRVVNRTGSPVVAALLRGKQVVREIYVAPTSAASLTHIGLGVYRVLLEAGSELDSATLRFRHPAMPPEIAGPLEFLEFSSARGTTGQFYQLILRPQGQTAIEADGAARSGS